jgi:CheY-like chemotaxis protein
MPNEARQDKQASLVKHRQWWFDLLVILGTIGAFMSIGVIGLLVQQMGRAHAALVCGAAFFSIGLLIGFLFGIPRVLQKETMPIPQPQPMQSPMSQMVQSPMSPPMSQMIQAPIGSYPGPGGAQTTTFSAPHTAVTTQTTVASTGYRIEVNTNLEQISDWLTKIIVGLGLVELRSMPDHLTKLATFLAVGIKASAASDDVHAAEVLALMTVVYFTLIGFFGGYLLTRTYLTGAFRRADEENLEISVPVGSDRKRDMFYLSLDQADELKKRQIDDLREQIIHMQERLAQQSGDPGKDGDRDKSGKTDLPRTGAIALNRILWVDDEPKNNSYLIAYLDSIGVEVLSASSSEEALAKLDTGRVDCVVTDMNHPDAATGGQPAGIGLVKRIRSKDSKLPVYIFTSRHSAQSYAQAARDAGVTEITDSPTQLLAALRRKA